MKDDMKKPQFDKQGARNGSHEVHKRKPEGGVPEQQRQSSEGTLESIVQSAAGDKAKDIDKEAIDTLEGLKTTNRNFRSAVGEALVNKTDKEMLSGHVSKNQVDKRPLKRGPVVTLILAIDAIEARACAEKNGLRPTEWNFLSGMDTLAASQMMNIVVWRTGKYYTRRNLLEIEAIIEKLGLTYTEAPV